MQHKFVGRAHAFGWRESLRGLVDVSAKSRKSAQTISMAQATPRGPRITGFDAGDTMTDSFLIDQTVCVAFLVAGKRLHGSLSCDRPVQLAASGCSGPVTRMPRRKIGRHDNGQSRLQRA